MSNLQKALLNTDSVLQGAFDSLLPEKQGDVLREAVRYALLGGGKRVRPFLVMQFGKLFGVAEADILQVAMAIEAMHCYSLVHDDLPCMDDSDLRRGVPSLHKQFDEATAVLVGDALLSLSFELVAVCGNVELVSLLAKASGEGGMVGGQLLDILGDVGGDVDLEVLQKLKTGCLFDFSCESMAILGGVDDVVRERVLGFSGCLGLLFQVTDDLLDICDSGTTGKDSGLDAERGRVTWVSLLGEGDVRIKARGLCDDGKGYLDDFGGGADLLRDLLDYLLVRKN